MQKAGKAIEEHIGDRKITMNLIKLAPEQVRQRPTKKKASMKQKLGLCMINDEFLFSVLQLL